MRLVAAAACQTWGSAAAQGRAGGSVAGGAAVRWRCAGTHGAAAAAAQQPPARAVAAGAGAAGCLLLLLHIILEGQAEGEGVCERERASPCC